MTQRMDWARRACVVAALLVLTACQAPPPAAPGLTQAQQQLLGSSGFHETDDGWELQMLGKLLFDFDSAVMGREAHERVLQLGKALSGAGITRLRVEGHTDDLGTDAYNLRLSLKRAEAVATVLAEGGFARSHIDAQGLGRQKPLKQAVNAENRRVAIIVPLQ